MRRKRKRRNSRVARKNKSSPKAKKPKFVDDICEDNSSDVADATSSKTPFGKHYPAFKSSFSEESNPEIPNIIEESTYTQISNDSTKNAVEKIISEYARTPSITEEREEPTYFYSIENSIDVMNPDSQSRENKEAVGNLLKIMHEDDYNENKYTFDFELPSDNVENIPAAIEIEEPDESFLVSEQLLTDSDTMDDDVQYTPKRKNFLQNILSYVFDIVSESITGGDMDEDCTQASIVVSKKLIHVIDCEDDFRKFKILRNQICKPVYSIKYISANTVLIGTSQNVQFYDLDAAENLKSYENVHSGPIWDIDFNAEYFATASNDGTASIFSFEFGIVRRCLGHKASVNAVKFHPMNKLIATGSSDKTVRLWSIKDGLCQRILNNHEHDVCCIAFDPNAPLCATVTSADSSGKIYVWDMPSGKVAYQFLACKEHNPLRTRINSICYSKDGEFFGTSCFDGTIKLWSVRNNTPECKNGTDEIDGYLPLFIKFDKKQNLRGVFCNSYL